MSEKPLEQMGLRDLRKIMRRKAPAEAWKHFNGAAETKATFHRNPRAFHQYLFRQKIFHDVAEPDISIELVRPYAAASRDDRAGGKLQPDQQGCGTASRRRHRPGRRDDVCQPGGEIRSQRTGAMRPSRRWCSWRT